jgi:hypothetical protein
MHHKHASVKVAGSKVLLPVSVRDGFVNPGLDEVKILDVSELSQQTRPLNPRGYSDRLFYQPLRRNALCVDR